MSDIHWSIVISSWNVSKQFQLRWNWYAPKSIAENDAITQPIMDEKGITYLSSAINICIINNWQNIMVNHISNE